MKKEESLHLAICRYIALQYPKAIFNTDLSGIRLTMGQSMAVKRMRSSNSFPDISIYEPRGPYFGLFIELKHMDARLLRKDGYLVADDRIKNQNKMLHDLSERGYLARFCQGHDQTIELIEWYMSQGDPNLKFDRIPPIPLYHEKK